MGENQSRMGAAVSGQSSSQTAEGPMEVITQQTCNESVEVIKGKDEDRLAWHVVLMPCDRQTAFQQKKRESWIQIDDFGRNILYRDKKGAMRKASGYGPGPPEPLITWINENYDPPAIDEHTPLTYTTDDIRLCAIQRLIPEDRLGIILYYHRHERFHYIKLIDDYESTLAFRAGIRSFDRVIECNNINIEEELADNLKKKIDNLNCQLLQLLVCSPATYAHYKANRKHLHRNLDTIKRLTPVHDIGNPRNNYQIVSADESLACVTLVNSMYTIPDHFGNTQFTSAQEPLGMTTMENESVLMHTTNSTLQTFYEQNDDDRERRQHKLIQQLTSLLGENQNHARNSIEIHQTRCLGCGSPRIYDDRYKCLECKKYDLCSRCFDQRRETEDHVNGHAVVHFSDCDEIFGEPVIDVYTTITLRKFKEKYSNEEHVDVQCKNCGMRPIKGLRFKCDVCHDYNLCITCMERRVHDKMHPLLTIGKSCFPQIPMNDIELDDELGRGGFGTVYKAKWLSKNRYVACKVINVRPEHKHHEKSFRKELAAYAEVSGPYILKTYGYNIQELRDDNRRCMLVMELMSRGSLSSVLRQKEKISLGRKVDMACQIASGMRKIHAHGMIHRDIRPDNILVTDDYTTKIGDMGLARVWMPDVKLTTIGCLPYMPLDFYTGKYDQSLDVYTFGLTIYELFTENKHHFDLVSRRIKITDRSPVFADLIDRCVHNEPSKRPTAIEIETTLRMYKHAIKKYIVEKNIKYTNMSTEDKNSMFIRIYHTLKPELDQILKGQFPPTRPVGELAGDQDTLVRFLEFIGIR